MAHRLLVPPVRRMEGVARLPMPQDPGGAAHASFMAGMRTRDALRLAKTTSRNKAIGPLPSPQTFVMDGPGYPNSPASMDNGLRVDNAPRQSGKTRGADVGFGPSGLGGRATAQSSGAA